MTVYIWYHALLRNPTLAIGASECLASDAFSPLLRPSISLKQVRDASTVLAQSVLG